ncbi:MAG TPA: patatin-like phospholipase family protein [Sphingobium sp.]|uniref:patatin-like phospholipase family protein n=1 Tax=Sphingobium sp. TaxID=1912891 RepID=UPI002ED594C4
MDMLLPSGLRGRPSDLPLPPEVALVLQGGGALGSFQAGVVESLFERRIPVTWVAGISIGAINAAIIAGNEPDQVVPKLRSFWETVSGGLPNFVLPENDAIKEVAHLGAAAAVAMFGVPGFFRPNSFPAPFAVDGSREAVSFYDTTPLRETLDRLVDWDRVNHGPVRLSVGAVDVETGNFDYFCTNDGRWRGRIDARHIMASGALPPGLPPVEIDGRWYWDGGIVSNTPLSHVIDNQEDDMLVFQCDLFPAEGPRPRTMVDALARQKDIQYSSRTRQVTDQYLRLRREHHAMERLLAKLPPEITALPEAEAVREMIDRGSLNVVHLIYRGREWESGAKDFEFSRRTMLDHWAQGGAAVAKVIDAGDRLIAQNILNGKSASFDLQGQGDIKEKQA